MTSKDDKARVSFAPGKTDAYVIVKGDHEEPYPGEQTVVYDDLDAAERRAEWLNWNSNSKQAGHYHHPREEAAAKKAQMRADLLAAHAALVEEERYGKAVAKQLAALRAERAREEQDAEQFEVWAGQDSRTVKARREYRKSAQQARKRAEGLAKKIAQVEASPARPSRLAAPSAKEEKGGIRASQAPAGAAGPHDAEPGGTAEIAS